MRALLLFIFLTIFFVNAQDGLIAIEYDGKYMLIDSKGIQHGPPDFDKISGNAKFSSGVKGNRSTVYFNRSEIFNKKRKVYFPNTGGELYSNNYFISHNKKKFFIHDSTGQRVNIGFKDSILIISHDKLILQAKNDTGILVSDFKGNILFEPNDSIKFGDPFTEARKRLLQIKLDSPIFFISPIIGTPYYNCSMNYFSKGNYSGWDIATYDKKSGRFTNSISPINSEIILMQKENDLSCLIKIENSDTFYIEDSCSVHSVPHSSFLSSQKWVSEIPSKLISSNGEVLLTGPYFHLGISEECENAVLVSIIDTSYPIINTFQNKWKIFNFNNLSFSDKNYFNAFKLNQNYYASYLSTRNGEYLEEADNINLNLFKLDDKFNIVDSLIVNNPAYLHPVGKFLLLQRPVRLFEPDTKKFFSIPDEISLKFHGSDIVMFVYKDQKLYFNAKLNKIIYSNFKDGTTEKLQAWLDSL